MSALYAFSVCATVPLPDLMIVVQHTHHPGGLHVRQVHVIVLLQVWCRILFDLAHLTVPDLVGVQVSNPDVQHVIHLCDNSHKDAVHPVHDNTLTQSYLMNGVEPQSTVLFR